VVDLSGYSDEDLRRIASGKEDATIDAPDMSNMSDLQLKNIVKFGAIAEGMSPGELGIARSKNDELGDYLRQQASQPKPGETEDDTFERQYGGLKKADRPGQVEGTIRALSEGVTFGHSGQIGAAGRAAYDSVVNNEDYSEGYKTRLAQSDTKLGQFKEDSPVLAYGAEIAGAIPTSALPILNVVRGGKILKGLGTGALQGLLYGEGQARGNQGEQAESIGKSAVIGGLVGGAGVPASHLVGKLANRYMTNKTAKAAGMTVPQQSTMIRALSADDTLAGGGAQRIASGGDDAMLTDSGVGMQRMLDAAITQSPPAAGVATGAVEGRVNRAASKLNTVLDNVMGAPNESASRALVVYGGKSNPLDELYERAYSKPVDYSSPLGLNIENMVRNRVPPEAIVAANKLMRIEGHASKQVLADISEDGSVIFREMPDVRQLDYITRGLNQTASTGEGAGAMGGQTPVGAAYKNLSREIRSALKDLVPEYKSVLNSAAGFIRSREARDVGMFVLSNKTTRADVTDALSDMGEAEIRKVVEGVRMNIDDVLAQTKAAMTDTNIEAREAFRLIREMSGRANREKLEMVLGDGAERIFNELDEAMVAFELRASVARNSATAIRKSTIEAVDDAVQGGAINRLREGQPLNAAKETASAIFGRSAESKQKISDDLYIDMVRALTGPRGAEARVALEKLQKISPLINMRTGQAMSMTEILASRNAPVTSPMTEERGAN
tara:strand:- start:57 stop:2234 length:2178 start_codon:yes stop_codon:yes gene_type:complete